MVDFLLQVGAVLVVVAVAVLLLGVGVFFTKRGFPNIHIGGNKELKRRGIDCYAAQDRKEFNQHK